MIGRGFEHLQDDAPVLGELQPALAAGLLKAVHVSPLEEELDGHDQLQRLAGLVGGQRRQGLGTLQQVEAFLGPPFNTPPAEG
jgi:hypothetical protein